MNAKLYLVAALALPMALTACDGNRSCNNGAVPKGGKEIVYTGTLPGADVSGIRYTLHLDYDDDHNFIDGDYNMYETYVVADSASVGGLRDVKTVRSEGDFKVENGAVSDNNLKCIKLVPDVRDSGPGVTGTPIYFAITSDSTLVMLGENMTMPERPQDYTLTAR